MRKTTISIEDEQYEKLWDIRHKTKKSFSQIIRELIDKEEVEE